MAAGLDAWGTNPHQKTAPGTYQVTETPFVDAVLSPSVLTKLTAYCGFIQANGSGFGICNSCRQGAQGASMK